MGRRLGPGRPGPATAPLPANPRRSPLALQLDLRSKEITTVLWATGFRPDHSWVDIPVRDRTGHIRHDGGVVTGAPGLYLLGLPVLRTRASTYIHGATPDTQALASHLHSFLSSRCRKNLRLGPLGFVILPDLRGGTSRKIVPQS